MIDPTRRLARAAATLSLFLLLAAGGAAAQDAPAPLPMDETLVFLALGEVLAAAEDPEAPPPAFAAGDFDSDASRDALALVQQWVAWRLADVVAEARGLLELAATTEDAAVFIGEWEMASFDSMASNLPPVAWSSEWKVSEMDGRSNDVLFEVWPSEWKMASFDGMASNLPPVAWSSEWKMSEMDGKASDVLFDWCKTQELAGGVGEDAR